MGKNDKKSLPKKKSQSKVRVILLTFIRVLLLLAVIGSFYKGRWLIFIVASFSFIVTFLPSLLKKQFGIKIPAELEIMLLFFIYGMLFLAEVRGFYAEFWWWDTLLNLASAIALGFIGLTIMYFLYKGEKIDASPFMVAVFAFSFAVAIGAVWELFEFSMDAFFGFNMQKSGLADTMGDMIVNVIGAFLVSTGGYFYIKSGRENLISNSIAKIIEKNPKLFKSSRYKEKQPENHPEGILGLIKKGEGENLEFKSTLRTNIHTKQVDKKVEHSVLKTIAAYLNSNGGSLLVGVSDTGEILGVDEDKFTSKDKLSLHLTNLIKQHIGNEYLPFIKHDLIPMDEKHILKIDCKESNKHVFLKVGKEEEFYVRNGPSSAKLSGNSLIDYINNKFNKQ